MKSFVKINVGDRVCNTVTGVVGEIVSIEGNHATILSGTTTIEKQHLSQLIQIDDELLEEESKLTGLDKAFGQVEEFHIAFDHPVADVPAPLELSRATDRSVWTIEEAVCEFLQKSSLNEEEFLQAYDNLLVGLEKAKLKSLKDTYHEEGYDRLVGQADALVDAMYFILGSFVEMGIKPDALFDIVQAANMSKLFTAEDGTKYAKYREDDGKILKSPEFFPPEEKLKEEILRQINQAK